MIMFNDDSRVFIYNTRDINEAMFVYSCIIDEVLNDKIEHIIKNTKPLEELIEIINEEIRSRDIKNLVNSYQKRYLNIKDDFIKTSLPWIFKNFNAGLFLWFNLFILQYEKGGRRERHFSEGYKPESNPESLEKIIIDITTYAMSRIYGIELLKIRINRIHSQYQKISSKKRLTWIKNDNEQSQWAYQYLLKKDREFKRYYHCDFNNELEFIKVYYDLNIDNPAVRLLYMEMNKAWNQHRYRDSRKDKKSLSGYISADAKNKLTAIAKKARMPEYELLEILILETYDREFPKR